MALVIGRPSPLRNAIVAAIARQGNADAIEPDHDDPFGAALHHDAVVYIPMSSVSVGEQASSPTRMPMALQAARAPGVQVLLGGRVDTQCNVTRHRAQPGA